MTVAQGPAQYFQEVECQLLAPYAVKSKYSKGRVFAETESPSRTCFQRDRDRIIHSNAFRRLKHKTQVFIATESDHYRSRLTHTIEVAQVSRHLSRLLRLNEDLAEGIALAHDLGHTPFGHAGERELNKLMKSHGGFEHNLQSRRVVDELEDKYPLFTGLNLSYELREGLMKHKTPWDRPELNDVTGFISLEAQVCNISDEIAYNNHDLDDGLRSKLLDEGDLEKEIELWKDAKAHIDTQYTALTPKHRKTVINSFLISSQIQDVITQTQKNIAELGIETLEDIQKIDHEIVTFSAEMKEKNTQLRKYLFGHFYFHPEVYRMNQNGQRIIRQLFEAFTSDTFLLPTRYQAKIRQSGEAHRVVCDYIAGMTDVFALKEYEQIFH